MNNNRASLAWIAVATMAAAPGASALGQERCCHVQAGKPVEVELVDRISTKTAHTGDTFAFRLAAPLIVDGQVVMPAGAAGVGEVVESSRRGMGGKGAKLVLAARYVGSGQARTPLQGLQLAAGGHDNTTAAQVVGLSGIAFGPLGLIGLAVPGGNVTFAAGTRATAAVSTDVELRPLRAATRTELMAANDAVSAQADAANGAIDIAPPPAGEGQIVFFRRKSLLGTGQWFKVRENGVALGKLSNGAYFIDVADPGRHAFTATMEPELKDRLTLEVAPGQTYFVEGTVTKALVLGAADLTPSDRAAFDHVSAKLKAARPAAQEVAAVAARDGATDASAERAPDPNAAAASGSARAPSSP